MQTENKAIQRLRNVTTSEDTTLNVEGTNVLQDIDGLKAKKLNLTAGPGSKVSVTWGNLIARSTGRNAALVLMVIVIAIVYFLLRR